jgi:V/A-type H+-transporting ATPase subunit K
MYIFLMPLLIVILLSLPAVNVIRKAQTGKKAKNALLFNIASFFGVLLLATILPIGTLVSAEDGAAVTAAVSGSSAGLGYIAASLAVGLGSIGCGIAVAAAAPAAIGAVSEEPKAFSKALIFVALGEGVALYGFLIAFMILGKL